MAPTSDKVTSSSVSDTRTPVKKRKETMANNKLKELVDLRKQEAVNKGLFPCLSLLQKAENPLLSSQTCGQTNGQG